MAIKIGVVTTGGTIGSILGDSAISVDPSEEGVKKEIEAVVKRRGAELELVSAFNKNSEDLDVADWHELAVAIEDLLERDIKRIVVTHGTDTLAYSAAAIAALFGKRDCRICITGSYLAPSAAKSDAALSISAAVESVASDSLQSGVFVAFRSNGKNRDAMIMPALSLKPMDFDAPAYSSAYDEVLATYSQKNGLNVQADISSHSDVPFNSSSIPTRQALSQASSKVALVQLYPSIDRKALEGISAGREILILDPYHSGTGPGHENSELLAFLKAKPDSLKVILGQFPLRFIPTPYASTVAIRNAGSYIVKDLQTPTLFAWAVIALAMGQSAHEFSQSLEEVTVK